MVAGGAALNGPVADAVERVAGAPFGAHGESARLIAAQLRQSFVRVECEASALLAVPTLAAAPAPVRAAVRLWARGTDGSARHGVAVIVGRRR